MARSNKSELALQMGLDYACGSVADCDPIKPSGLCYLPNTVQSHTSYALNSYYQRKANAPSSCDFNGTAITTNTDPTPQEALVASTTFVGNGWGRIITTADGICSDLYCSTSSRLGVKSVVHLLDLEEARGASEIGEDR
ncbi:PLASMODESMATA CALLOSE-BINDING PROTEIN 1-like [Rhododendron vialii]|uniref:PLASMODESMATA CALLOSE-BINDING PROTEIN 1-like n=1 Tax=Rhododendron vialii TaxID=182163 RepID=UPI00265EBBDB|nr:PLASMODESMATA CALLOSE-BINDING PROTEIN 1-like [Rhododendron vialii]